MDKILKSSPRLGAVNLPDGQRAERKLLITVAEWGEGATPDREILGTRVEDSSIEFNTDVQKMTDIRGITYTDVNKTEPEQSFDTFALIGGSKLGTYMNDNALKNNISAYNGKFTIYVITAYSGTTGAYFTVKHTGCSIIPESLGGDAWVQLPITVHFSNNITEGTVDKLADDFVFIPNTSI